MAGVRAKRKKLNLNPFFALMSINIILIELIPIITTFNAIVVLKPLLLLLLSMLTMIVYVLIQNEFSS
jgi:hypothetical protein